MPVSPTPLLLPPLPMGPQRVPRRSFRNLLTGCPWPPSLEPWQGQGQAVPDG